MRAGIGNDGFVSASYSGIADPVEEVTRGVSEGKLGVSVEFRLGGVSATDGEGIQLSMMRATRNAGKINNTFIS